MMSQTALEQAATSSSHKPPYKVWRGPFAKQQPNKVAFETAMHGNAIAMQLYSAELKVVAKAK
jgi:hypothetical protein